MAVSVGAARNAASGGRGHTLVRMTPLPEFIITDPAGVRACCDDVAASTHASPEDALDAAAAAAGPTDRILVFGSFFTVGGVLKQGLPRLTAKHLG